MVEATLNVKLTHLSNVTNPFYGKVIREKEVKDTLTWEKDERENIAPFGIRATIHIERIEGDCDIFDFNVTNHYFEEDVLPNTYHCLFTIDNKVYELAFGIKNSQIADLTLCEWESYGDFEDCEEPSHYYHKEKFVSYYKMYL